MKQCAEPSIYGTFESMLTLPVVATPVAATFRLSYPICYTDMSSFSVYEKCSLVSHTDDYLVTPLGKGRTIWTIWVKGISKFTFCFIFQTQVFCLEQKDRIHMKYFDIWLFVDCCLFPWRFWVPFVIYSVFFIVHVMLFCVLNDYHTK